MTSVLQAFSKDGIFYFKCSNTDDVYSVLFQMFEYDDFSMSDDKHWWYLSLFSLDPEMTRSFVSEPISGAVEPGATKFALYKQNKKICLWI